MSRKTDLRVIKTQNAIHEAFLKLMNTKGLSAMTVQDILDEALINRKTFYTYYRSKYDLAEQTAAEFLQRFDAILAERFPDGDFARSGTFPAEEIYSELLRYKNEFLAVLDIRTDRINVQKELERRLQKVYRDLAGRCGAPGDRELQSYLFSSLVLTSYRHIMAEDRTYETHQLLNEFQQISKVIAETAAS